MKIRIDPFLIAILFFSFSCEKNDDTKAFRVVNLTEHLLTVVCMHDLVLSSKPPYCDVLFDTLSTGETSDYFQYKSLDEPLTIEFKLFEAYYHFDVIYDSFDSTNAGSFQPGQYSILIHSIDTFNSTVMHEVHKE